MIVKSVSAVSNTQKDNEIQQISVPAPEISVNIVPPQNEIRVELVKIPPSPRPCVDLGPAEPQDPAQGDEQAPSDTRAPSSRRKKHHHHHRSKPQDDDLALDWDQ